MANELIGKWVFKNAVDLIVNAFNLSFKSNGASYTRIESDREYGVYYDSTLAYGGEGPWGASWQKEEYKTIEITDVSKLGSQEQAFTTWLKANATKQMPKAISGTLQNENGEILHPETSIKDIVNEDGTPYEPPKGGGLKLYEHHITFGGDFRGEECFIVSTESTSFRDDLSNYSSTIYNVYGGAEVNIIKITDAQKIVAVTIPDGTIEAFDSFVFEITNDVVRPL